MRSTRGSRGLGDQAGGGGGLHVREKVARFDNTTGVASSPVRLAAQRWWHSIDTFEGPNTRTQRQHVKQSLHAHAPSALVHVRLERDRTNLAAEQRQHGAPVHRDLRPSLAAPDPESGYRAGSHCTSSQGSAPRRTEPTGAAASQVKVRLQDRVTGRHRRSGPGGREVVPPKLRQPAREVAQRPARPGRKACDPASANAR
jgi:hypothetical protein